MSYKIFKNNDGIILGILRSDGASIPKNPDNTDYQAYLKWVSEGNEPLPAETE